MPTSRPIADVQTAGWTSHAGGTTDLYTHVNEVVRDDTDYVQTTINTGAPPGPVLLFVVDDLNPHYVYGYVQPGFGLAGRGGTRVWENLWSRVIDRGTNFSHMIATYGPCWPTRAELYTSLFRKNHKVRVNATSDYVAHYVTGIYESVAGRGNEPTGPWGTTLASTFGPEKVPVTDAAHATALAANPQRAGWTGDDLQAFTGSWIHEIARAGYPCAMFGKWDPWDTTASIPAGFKDGAFQYVQGGTQWNALTYSRWTVDNPWDGPGVATSDFINSTSSYQKTTGTATWAATNGGELTITGAGSHLFEVGDICGLRNTTNATITRYDYVVTSSTGSGAFKVACTVNPLTGSSLSVQVYNRQEYPIFKLTRWACDFLDACHEANTTPFLYMAPHIPHDTGIAPNGYGTSFERMYEGAVAAPAGNGMWYDGVETQVCPTGHIPPTSTEVATFQAVMQMLCSADDALGIILDKIEEHWGDNYTVIVTADNGKQNGEQSTNGNGTAKDCIWQGSASTFLFIKGPKFGRGVRQDRVCCLADIGLTVLDLFEQDTNHCHDDRDGVSLLRVFDPSHPAYNRVIPVYGSWKTLQGQGYVLQSFLKFVQPDPSTGILGKTYDIRLPSEGGDYETIETDVNTLTSPTLAQRIATFNLIDDARWNPTSNTNPAHDGTITG